MSYRDQPPSGDRRVYNVGSHAGSFGGYASINHRADDINDSGHRSDHNFDNSFDAPNQNFITGGIGEVANTLLKKSNTQQVRTSQPQVTFGDTHPRNHPLQLKGHSSTGQLERIDEKKSNSPSLRSGKHPKKSGETPKKHNNHEISNLTINSISMDESVKAPNRPPIQIEGLTQFLIDGHYKWYGVNSKDAGKLMRYWKEFISIAYRERKRQHTQIPIDVQIIHAKEDEQKKKQSWPVVRKDGQPLYAKSENILQLEKYGLCFEMDVQYTLQKDLEHENNEMKMQQNRQSQLKKEFHEKQVKEVEEDMITMACDLYYKEKVAYFIAILRDGTYRDDKIEERMKKWYKHVAEKKLLAAGLPDLDTIKKEFRSKSRSKSSKRTKSLTKTPEENKENKNNNTLDISKISKDSDAAKLDVSQNTSKTEVKSSAGKKIKEDEKDPEKESKEIKEKRESIIKKMEKEQKFILHLLKYMREKDTLTNDPEGAYRLFKDCKDKAKHEILWPKGDSNAEKIIYRYFRAESTIVRLMTVYYYTLEKKPRYRHLTLFGFYLQLKQRERLLYSVDWPKIKHPHAYTSICDLNDVDHSDLKKKIKENFKEDKQRGISIEEMIADLEIFYKFESKIRRDFMAEERRKAMERHRDKLLEEVFGKEHKKELMKRLQEKKTSKYYKELARPKDKWKRLRILMELKKKFRHDITLEKMIKEELKDNRVFKFPEEYDLYDDQEDKLCKGMYERIDEKKEGYSKELSKGKLLREKFKALDDQDLYYLNKEIKKKRREEHELDKYLIKKALEYLEQKKKRLSGKIVTVREFVSEVYHKIYDKFKDLVKIRFPNITYGQDKDSKTYKKSFPSNFKTYFFRLVRSHFREKKGKMKRFSNAGPAFILPAGRSTCMIHENMPCPVGCNYASFNKKVVLRSNQVRDKFFKEPTSFRSRVWRRQDFAEALDKVLMLNSEKENCRFEPEAGSLSQTMALSFHPKINLNREFITKEPDIEAYMVKLGVNFEKSHPEVYKAGVLKRAQLMAREGRFDDALKRLYQGFNVESIKKRFDPTYMKRLIGDIFLKKKTERESKEREERSKSKTSGLERIENLKDQHETQKKMPEEDYDNKKLIPIFREAFDLIQKIENRKVQAQKRIKQIQRRQKSLKKSLRSFSTYKRSQTRMDDGKEMILYRTIMCPLKDKCPSDMRPRWPTSNTRSKTKFGQECPFAHHPMELQFPESIITKLSSSYQTIASIKSKIDQEKPRDVFKPSGKLFDCRGCFSKGQCNLCLYKFNAEKSSLKFNDKQRKDSLRRSMQKRESSEVKQDQKAMEKVMEELDLDDNYTLKFGHLKKACVLYFYGRYNDSFDEVAKAAEIIQKQREVEKQKQALIEKRWKFKLNIDDGFELPMPIDQIDPNKIDEKFLKKLDLQGVAVSTLKLYIEQVAPQGNQEFSKHKFLNKCIEDFYLQCESMLEDKLTTIAKMKKQVEKLDEEAEMMEAMQGMESSPERSPEKGATTNSFGESTRRIKPKKTKMCPNMENHGKCKLSPARCAYAHNPIELDLIPVETKMKNLQGVIQSQTLKMKNMKPLEPWKPVKSGDIIHTHLMDMTSKGRKKKGADGEEEDENEGRRKQIKRKSIFDRENIKRKPYEVNE